MAIVVNDIIRLSARLRKDASDQIINVFHVRVTVIVSPGDAGVLDSLANYIEDVYIPIDSDMSDRVTFDDIDMFNISQNMPLPEQPWPTLTVGTNINEPLPDGVAALLKGTTVASRKQGKKYFGGYTEAGNNGGLITAAAQTNLAAAGVAWGATFVDISGDTLLPGIYTRLTGAFHSIQSVILNPVWAYQRRRKPGVGS